MIGVPGPGGPELSEEETELLRQERVEARLVREEFERLLACPGWRRLVETAARHQHQREQEVVYSTEEELRERGTNRDRLAGEAAGIRLFVNLPDLVMAHVREIVGNGEEEPDDETE